MTIPFAEFLEKAKSGKLRAWLDVEQVQEYLAGSKGKPLWFLIHNTRDGSLVKVDAKAMYFTEIREGDGKLKDVKISCALTVPDGERTLIVSALNFVPGSDTVSRLFSSIVQRDLYFDELKELNEALLESHTAYNVYRLKRFLGGMEGPTGSNA